MAIITISPKGTLSINQKRSKTYLALARLTKVVKYTSMRDPEFERWSAEQAAIRGDRKARVADLSTRGIHNPPAETLIIGEGATGLHRDTVADASRTPVRPPEAIQESHAEKRISSSPPNRVPTVKDKQVGYVVPTPKMPGKFASWLKKRLF